MKNTITFFVLFLSINVTSQIKGKVVDTKNNPLSFVSIYLDGTITGTTSNEDGFYELPIKKTGNYTVVFQYLGFKTLKKSVKITSFPFRLNVKMIEEQVTLSEVNINSFGKKISFFINNIQSNFITIRKSLSNTFKRYRGS